MEPNSIRGGSNTMSAKEIQDSSTSTSTKTETEATTTTTTTTTSPVARMFENKSIFITGASGFIGRVLLEKLLRCYPGIKRIYILLRTKRNQHPQERLHKQLLKVPIFDPIREAKNGQELFDKIVVVPGDIGEPQLGMSDEDYAKLVADETLSIVFHSAATVKFDEPIKVSVQLNLIGTKMVLDLCKKLPNLITLCHVSSAFVNSDIKDNQIIEEKVYPIKETPEQLIELARVMDESLMQCLKGNLVGQRPNTYTYTKAVTEHLILSEANNLPIVIVRPSIVTAAWKDPIPGWIDNLNGPTGLILAAGKGLMRTMHVVRDVKADIIPVDLVVNTMIASVFYGAKINNKLDETTEDNLTTTSTLNTNQQISNHFSNSNNNNEVTHDDRLASNPETKATTTQKTTAITSNDTNTTFNNNNIITRIPTQIAQKSITKSSKEKQLATSGVGQVPIFHINSGDKNPVKWGVMEHTLFDVIKQYPSSQVLRYPFGTFKSSKSVDMLTRLFVHLLPALIIDFICGMMGKKKQLLTIYHKLHTAMAMLAHFCTQNYNFQTRNIKLLEDVLTHEQDRRDLYMDIKPLNWDNYWHDYVLGARRFVLKEPDHTLEEARKSFLRAYYIEIALRAILIVMVSFGCFTLTMRTPTIEGAN